MFTRVILCWALLVLLASCGGGTKEELYASGMDEISKANPNGAIVYFRNALEKDPDFKDTRIQLARAYIAVGKSELAEKEFHKATLHEPTRVELKLELAKLYIFSNKPDTAIIEIEEYIKTQGETPEALELTGIAYVAKNKPGEAERKILQALKAEPGRTSAKLELATVYVHFRALGKAGEVRRLANEVIASDARNTRAYYLLAQLELSAGDKDKALEIYSKIIAIDGMDVRAPYASGLLYVEKGDLDKAWQIATGLAQKFPKRGEGIRLKGIVDYSRKKYLDAIPELHKSITISPAPEAYCYLGLSYLNKGDLETALSQFRMILENNPFAEQARFLTALILVKQGRVDDAIAEIKTLLAKDPGFALAHNLLGSAYMAKGMYDEGMAELNRAIALDPGIVDAHMKKGIFHLRGGRYKEAESDFSTAVNIAPEQLETRLVLACFYIRQKDYSKAMSLLNQALTGKKGDAVIYNNMAAIMYAQGKLPEGLEYLKKASKADPEYLGALFNIATFYVAGNQPDKAVDQYREILRLSPDNGKALLGMAALLERQGKDDEAYKYYKKAANNKENAAYMVLAVYMLRKGWNDKALSVLDDAIANIPRNIQALEMKLRLLLADKKFKDALRLCEDIASINPEQGLRDKVNTYLAMKDVPKALEHTRRFITLNPNSGYGYMVLAAILESRNELDKAISEMKKGVGIDGDNLPAILILGDLYVKKKDYKSAMAEYTETLRKDPDFVPGLFAEGALLDEMGDKDKAMEKYREALLKSEGYVPALNNLAYLYVDGHGSPQEGLRLAFKAFVIEPANPMVLDTLGYALLKNKRGPESLKHMENAAALMPGNPSIQYHLALAFEANGMRDKARASLKKSLKLGDFPEAASARKLLAQ